MSERLLTLAELADLLVSLGEEPDDASPETSATSAANAGWDGPDLFDALPSEAPRKSRRKGAR
jgi:hypothetical protein